MEIAEMFFAAAGLLTAIFYDHSLFFDTIGLLPALESLSILFSAAKGMPVSLI
jgi:hypothetical protein